MAKKSTKPSRRVRAKREDSKKKTGNKAKETTVDNSTTDKIEKPIKPAIVVESAADEIAVEDMVAPQRKRMLISAAALCIVIVALIFTAVTMRAQQGAKNEMVQSGHASEEADKILQSGGGVCTNGGSATNNQGSANPESVGMMLQNVPANDIQTPENFAASSDLNTLQSASCF